MSHSEGIVTGNDAGGYRLGARHGAQVFTSSRKVSRSIERDAPLPEITIDDRAQVRQRIAAEDLVVPVRAPVRGGEVHGVGGSPLIEEDLARRRSNGAVPASDVRFWWNRDTRVDLARGGRADRRLQRLALRAAPSRGRQGVAPRRDRLSLQRRRWPGRRDLGDALKVPFEGERHNEAEGPVVGAPH